MTNKEVAKHVFARNPKIDKLHVASDGQAFTEKHQCEGHAQRLKDQKIDSFSRKAEEIAENIKSKVKKLTTKKADILDGNVSEVADKVKAIGTVEELNTLAEREKAGDDRKGVKEAIDKRIAELSEDDNNDQDETGTGDDNNEKNANTN